MTDCPAPEQRVRDYLDAVQPYITQIADDNSYQLDVSDLRDVLNELEEHRSLLAEIDKVLDNQTEFSNEDSDTLYDIRNLLGNRTDRKRPPKPDYKGRVQELEDRIGATKHYLSQYAYYGFVPKAIEMMEEEP